MRDELKIRRDFNAKLHELHKKYHEARDTTERTAIVNELYLYLEEFTKSEHCEEAMELLENMKGGDE